MTAPKFLVDECCPAAVARALDELDYFCAVLKVLGVYPAHAFRGLA